MKQGYLSEYFDGVAGKTLSAVEASVLISNQHEFNGVEGLRQILGEPDGKVSYPARTIYLSDNDENPIIEDTFFTWYDARQKARLERGINRWEYRLYFPTTNVSLKASEGDLLIIAKRKDGGLLVIIAEKRSSIASQLKWLFNFQRIEQPGFSIKLDLDTERDRIAFTSRLILESIGIEINSDATDYLEEIIRKFGNRFPTTKEFSTFARSTLKDVNPKDGVDEALMAWMEREEILFRTLERHLITDRLSSGFNITGTSKVDVDGFLNFSLSVQNRRKSRVGYALENHLEVIFKENDIHYSRAASTENKSKPDFLFPTIDHYQDPSFPSTKLTMLGVKTTCKDRWRQVLAEADRIVDKHLLTLEPSISSNQTDEMRAKRLQLVLPYALHSTYTDKQRQWLMSVADFTKLVLSRQ